MKVFIILAVLVSVAVAQVEHPPIPYSFNYVAETEDGGRSSRRESGDAAGRVEGSYTADNLEGHSRVVDYVADEAGFRASIRTNEPGTASINPADVTIDSSAPDVTGVTAYLGGGAQPAPATRPVTPTTGGRSGIRYVLVPITDPRARGYY